MRALFLEFCFRAAGFAGAEELDGVGDVGGAAGGADFADGVGVIFSNEETV